MTQLSVNINKVALLRNQRDLDFPSPAAFARIALDAGAYGITVHPRPDQRHIRPIDVEQCAALLSEQRYADKEFNIEGNPFLGDYMAIVREHRPTQCTLVPDDPGARTSDHGWDVKVEGARLKDIATELQALGCRVSLFMDPDPEQIAAVPGTGAERIELYTEPYASAFTRGGDALEQAHERFHAAAAEARRLGLVINAGHDLNLENLGRFITIPGIEEVSIGHALIADALEVGMAAAVGAYLEVLRSQEH